MTAQNYWDHHFLNAWKSQDLAISPPETDSPTEMLNLSFELSKHAFAQPQAEHDNLALFLLHLSQAQHHAFWMHALGFYIRLLKTTPWMPDESILVQIRDREDHLTHHSVALPELIYSGDVEQIVHTSQLDLRLQSKPSSERLALINEEYGLWQQAFGTEVKTPNDQAFLFHALPMAFEGYQVEELYQRSQAAPMLVTLLQRAMPHKTLLENYFKTLLECDFFKEHPLTYQHYEPLKTCFTQNTAGTSLFAALGYFLLTTCEALDTNEQKQDFCENTLEPPLGISLLGSEYSFENLSALFKGLRLFKQDNPFSLSPTPLFYELYDTLEQLLCEYRDYAPEEDMPENKRKMALLAWYLYRDLDYVLDQYETFIDNCQEIILRDFEPHENLPGQFKVADKRYWQWLESLTPSAFLDLFSESQKNQIQQTLNPPMENKPFWPQVTPL